MPGVLRAEVSHAGATAIVGHDPGVVSAASLRQAIQGAGYSVTGEGTFQTIQTRGSRPWVQAYIDHVVQERCTGCGRCVEACGQQVYTLVAVDGGSGLRALVVNGDNCLGDCHCHKACRFGALVCKPRRLSVS